MHARRIRISFSDPDATESDSGDDASSAAATNTRPAAAAARKTEIVILVGQMVLAENTSGRSSKGRAAVSSPTASGKKRGGVKAERPPAPKRRFRGVYERQPGRWAAEFRSHRLKVRHWLGTFPTEEEAKAAYDAFEARFLSLPRDAVLPPPPPPLPERGDCGDGAHSSRASHPPDYEKKQIVQALMSTKTTITAMVSSSAREGSVSSSTTPCISSLTTASPSPTSQNAQPLRAGAPGSVDGLFLDNEPAVEEDLVGLADLSDLPLPFLDDDDSGCLSLGDLSLGDLSPADLSLFDMGFL